MKLAITGKGGVGKTTIAATLAYSFRDRGYNVYAIDADPDANLAYMLGIKKDVKPLVELKEVIAEKVGGEDGLYTLNPDVDDVLEEYTVKHEGIMFLQMGGFKQANSSCYCRENSFLRSIIENLLFKKDEVVIMDMGAGIEHLTRGTSRGVDMMMVVCEPSVVSFNTAEHIKELAKGAGVPGIKYIANKIRKKEDREFLQGKGGNDFITMLEYDNKLQKKNLSEEPPLLANGIDKIEKYISKVQNINKK